jgi:uncharacterized membrane protein YeiH
MIQPFEIPLAAELAAVGLGALQGALFAGQFKAQCIDLLGVVLIGIGVALGGSLSRDILLGVTPTVIQSNWYLLTGAVAALVGMLLLRLFDRLSAVIHVLDAVTIGTFGAIGTTKALTLGAPEIPAVFVGAVAAVGGSVVRDVTLNLPVALLHVGSLYAVAAAAGAVLLVVLAALGFSVIVAGSACIVVTTVIRLLAVRFHWIIPQQRALEIPGDGKARRRAALGVGQADLDTGGAGEPEVTPMVASPDGAGSLVRRDDHAHVFRDPSALSTIGEASEPDPHASEAAGK